MSESDEVKVVLTLLVLSSWGEVLISIGSRGGTCIIFAND